MNNLGDENNFMSALQFHFTCKNAFWFYKILAKASNVHRLESEGTYVYSVKHERKAVKILDL